MADKVERILEPDGTVIPWLYVRRYRNKKNRAIAKYYAIFTDWTGRRRRLPLGDELKKARKKLADVERKNDAEYNFDGAKTRKMTFSVWAAQCQNAMRERDSSLLIHLKTFFGSTALDQIDDKDLIDYRAQRLTEPIIRQGKETSKKPSPTTINKELGLLRKLMRLAQPKSYVKAMPKFIMEREPHRERKLNDEEYSALLEKSPVWLRPVCVAACETALSRSDLLGLTWNEIDRKNWVISLKDGRDKTKVRQEIPIRRPR